MCALILGWLRSVTPITQALLASESLLLLTLLAPIKFRLVLKTSVVSGNALGLPYPNCTISAVQMCSIRHRLKEHEVSGLVGSSGISIQDPILKPCVQIQCRSNLRVRKRDAVTAAVAHPGSPPAAVLACAVINREVFCVLCSIRDIAQLRSQLDAVFTTLPPLASSSTTSKGESLFIT